MLGIERRDRRRILPRTLLIATATVAVFFAVAGALLASSWIEAQRHENLWMECDVRTQPIGAAIGTSGSEAAKTSASTSTSPTPRCER